MQKIPLWLLVLSVSLVAVLALSGCDRSPLDVVVSGMSQRDCSMVSVEKGKPYCRPAQDPMPAPMVCQRTLGNVNCWANPGIFQDPIPMLADQAQPTAEQESYQAGHRP